jgi:phage N-6-adenine-methyltransferase
MTESTTPTNERDEARTPPSLFKILDDRFGFHLDACATSKNTLCQFYWDINADSIKQEWHKLPGMNEDPRIYCNPPYSRGNINRFIKKGYEESLKGATVVMLLPMDSSTVAFHKYCMNASEWIIFQPRVKFLRPCGIPFSGSPKFGSFACVFKQEEFDGSPIVSSMRWK